MKKPNPAVKCLPKLRQRLPGSDKHLLSDLLARCNGNVAKSAREARMNRSRLIDLLRRHGLK